MVDRKHDPRDRNIWKSPGGALFFKLGIPPNLRSKFLSSTGKPKTKISEPLGTDSLTEARVFRDQKLAHYQRVFARMNAGVDLLPEEIKAEVTKYRAQVPMPELAALLIKPTSSGDPSKPDVDSMIEQQVGPALDEVGKRLGFERHSEQWYALGIALVKSNWAALGKQVIAAAVGEQPAPTPVEQPPAVANRNRNSNGNLERFSIALGHYLDWMRDVRKARIATIADYKSKAQRFQKFANDPSLGAATIEQAKAFLNEVEAEGVSAATVNFHHVVCKAVFEHARRERHMFSGDNPFGFQRRKHKTKKRAKYTVDELNRLFNSPTFTEREIKPETYGVVSALPWAAVLALYSGLGLEEAAQLRPRDLRIEHGNGWVIYVEHEAALSGKLKSEGHERTVPLHPELERLGLLKYHATLPRNAERLFPNLPIHDSKGKRGPTLGQAFNNWRRNLGINYKDRPLDFHSLRHTFGKMMEDLGISEPDRARLLGHAVPGIGSSVYSAPELKRVAPLVAKVKWEGLEIP
jgi:integrase